MERESKNEAKEQRKEFMFQFHKSYKLNEQKSSVSAEVTIETDARLLSPSDESLCISRLLSLSSY